MKRSPGKLPECAIMTLSGNMSVDNDIQTVNHQEENYLRTEIYPYGMTSAVTQPSQRFYSCFREQRFFLFRIQFPSQHHSEDKVAYCREQRMEIGRGIIIIPEKPGINAVLSVGLQRFEVCGIEKVFRHGLIPAAAESESLAYKHEKQSNGKHYPPRQLPFEKIFFHGLQKRPEKYAQSKHMYYIEYNSQIGIKNLTDDICHHRKTARHGDHSHPSHNIAPGKRTAYSRKHDKQIYDKRLYDITPSALPVPHGNLKSHLPESRGKRTYHVHHDKVDGYMVKYDEQDTDTS